MTEATLLQGDLRLAGKLDARFFALLQAVADTGSINRAARTAGYSYKGAWLLLEQAGELARQPLVTRAVGGRGGGGSALTPAALQLLAAWRQLQAAHRRFLSDQDIWLTQDPLLAGLLRRIGMKTTARNQFAGRIATVDIDGISAQVTLALPGGETVTASLTHAAAQRLKVEPGRDAIALVKSSEVVLVTDFAGYALSARNQLAGTVSRVERSAVSSLVVLTLAGGSTVTASVTNDAVDALELAIGQAATAVFKAYAVMLAVARD